MVSWLLPGTILSALNSDSTQNGMVASTSRVHNPGGIKKGREHSFCVLLSNFHEELCIGQSKCFVCRELVLRFM